MSIGAPGFEQLPDPQIGKESFAGTSAGTDPVTGVPLKHIGVGVRVGNMIVGVTHAGYDANPLTIRKIEFAARLQTLKAAWLVPVYRIFGR